MNALKEPYRGETLTKSTKRLLHDLARHRPEPFLYVLTLSGNREEQLDIYPGLVYRQKNCILDELCIVGLAHGKSEAFDLAAKMAEDACRETGRPDIRAYLEKKERRA